MKRFEYKMLKIKVSKSWLGVNVDKEAMTQELNSLGRHGWELISPVHNADGFGHSKPVLILKRALD